MPKPTLWKAIRNASDMANTVFIYKTKIYILIGNFTDFNQLKNNLIQDNRVVHFFLDIFIQIDIRSASDSETQTLYVQTTTNLKNNSNTR